MVAARHRGQRQWVRRSGLRRTDDAHSALSRAPQGCAGQASGRTVSARQSAQARHGNCEARSNAEVGTRASTLRNSRQRSESQATYRRLSSRTRLGRHAKRWVVSPVTEQVAVGAENALGEQSGGALLGTGRPTGALQLATQALGSIQSLLQSGGGTTGQSGEEGIASVRSREGPRLSGNRRWARCCSRHWPHVSSKT